MGRRRPRGEGPRSWERLDALLAGVAANISGYPLQPPAGAEAHRQYFHARSLSSSERGLLRYSIDTSGGQSGSPIWIEVDGTRIAVGIHTSGDVGTNSGVRITEDVFRDMRQWKSR
jgi:V8-like Glu-specific endopeptidase